MLGTLAHRPLGPLGDALPRAPLERLMLHRLGQLDPIVRKAYADFDYAKVVAALASFMNVDLSAFYFDIRKDALYCDAPSSATRREALDVVERIFRYVTVWLAPILVFTCEEGWASRDPTAGSVHLEQFPTAPAAWRDEALARRWDAIRRARSVVTGALEKAREAKAIGSSLEARPRVYVDDSELKAALAEVDFAEVCITSGLVLALGARGAGRRLPPGGGLRRRGRRRARAGRQMRALLALFRPGDRRPRLSRRQPARRSGAARARPSCGGRDARARHRRRRHRRRRRARPRGESARARRFRRDRGGAGRR